MQINVAAQLGESVGSIRNYQFNENIDSPGDGGNCVVEIFFRHQAGYGRCP